MRTEDLEAFFAVVEGGGVTAAATKLALPKSTISRRLGRLEEELDAQLILRTPRQLQVTEIGHALHQRGLPAIRLLDELQRDLREQGSEPQGLLRISAPADLAARHLGPLCAAFLSEFPKVQIELSATNTFVDLIRDGVDVALRAHGRALADSSSLKAKRLCNLEVGLYAAPEYLERAGRPRRPEALAGHAYLSMIGRGSLLTMTHARTGRAFEIDSRPILASDEHQLLTDAAVNGAGIATLPSFLGAAEVETGRLERVLPAWSMQSARLSAVWPTAAHTSPRVQRFIKKATDFFRPPPWSR